MKGWDDLELVYQPIYYQIKIKVTICQTDSIMTLNCELFQSEFSVLSGRLIKNMFPLHICRPNHYTIEISAFLQIQIYNIFTNVPSIIGSFHIPKVVNNILKIYQLPKIYQILKKLLTIITYQVNSMSELHLASELYWKCTLGGQRTLLALN